MIACGIDEAGRGPVFGPLVICGLCARDEDLIPLGVKDSKLLSPDKRESLYPKILDVSMDYSIEVIGAEKIDEMMKIYTLNEIEAIYFAKVIDQLNGDKFIVDAADVNEDRFAKMILKYVGKEVKIISKHKADRNYPVVSAASIIAKVTRDREIEKIRSKIGDFGSGYPSDQRTVDFLKSYYKKTGNFPPYVRHSWKTLEKLITLDNFLDGDSDGKTF
ncbi:MAG: ribonuclease HII [Thermoplasmata archaeon]